MRRIVYKSITFIIWNLVVMFLLRRKLQGFLRKFGLLLEDAKFLTDEAKYSMVFSRIIIDAICVWPTNFSGFRKAFFLTMIILEAVHQMTMFTYLFVYVRDVETLAAVLPSLSIGMQVISHNLSSANII